MRAATERVDVYRERAGCPLYTAIAVIAGRWKPMILRRLSERPLGFGELRRAMPKVTTKVLREQLRQLIADDLVVRQPLVPAHLGVEYSVTAYGRSLEPVLVALWHWGTRHLARPRPGRGTIVAPPASSARPGAP